MQLSTTSATTLKKNVLYIAYHYPPVLGSSGVHRSLSFTRHLSENGWDTTVLTSSLKGYAKWSPSQFSFIPSKVKVIRAFCRDTTRHFSFKGKYLDWMALPDNWQSWIVGGVFSGLFAIIKNRPAVIVSTYPIASAHIIAYILHRLTGVAWVADLRDPMAQEDYPKDRKKKLIFEWIENKIIKRCKYAVVTAPGAKKLYQHKFPLVNSEFWQLVPNGFDKHIFDQVISNHTLRSDIKNHYKTVFLHSGVIYPEERNPYPLFEALAELKREGELSVSSFEMRLRATGCDELYAKKLKQLELLDIVTLLPSIPYKEALEEMLGVNVLMLLQSSGCNFQIPAKTYEYIKTKKPILALTPLEGDTGQLLSTFDGSKIASLDSISEIKNAIKSLLDMLKNGEGKVPSDEDVDCYSRESQAVQFERLLLEHVMENKQ